MQGRLLLGLMVLAMVPAVLGVILASALLRGQDAATVTEQARQTSAVAADLLVRSQAIEARLAALAADPDVAKLSTASSSSGTRQLARRTTSSLRGGDGSIVAGACITRVGDRRTTVIAHDRGLSSPEVACASGRLLATSSAMDHGTVARSHLRDSGRLLIATPVAGRFDDYVLSATIDLDRLLQGVPPTAPSAATRVIVERDTSAFVAGSIGAGGDATNAAQLQPRTLASHAEDVFSGLPGTTDALVQAGWTATAAELWPISPSGRLGLIQAWPASAGLGMVWVAIAGVAIAALVGVLILMRLLIKPFRELRESRFQLEALYREAREDSLHDGQTGLGNHRAFQDELARQVKRSERDGLPFSIMLVDLDNLKVVNDHEGHAEGDRLLQALARAMREVLRHTDRIFRIGGDEFAVLLPATEPERALDVATRLRHYCLQPPNGERPTPFSGGISAVPRFALEAGLVQRQADAALYWAKRHGRGFVEIFEPDRDQLPDVDGPSGLSEAVYEVALKRMFTPVYQPIVDLRTGAVLGFEGLVRPLPDAPIADAEQLFGAAAATGRSVELDLASFESVAEGAKGIGSNHVISMNLSAKTLEVRDFDAAWLLNTLVRHGISPARVIFELTERERIEDLKRLRDNVEQLGQYGLRLAADDVGAGTAGLRMLAEVPFDVVKIDLSLVQSGSQNEAAWAVLRSIRDLAWRQHSVVIGEGVETPDQLRALQQLEIPVGQGYLLGRPAPEIDTRTRDLADLVADPQSGAVAPPPRGLEDVQGLPSLPELQVEASGPQPLPVQLLSQPVG